MPLGEGVPVSAQSQPKGTHVERINEDLAVFRTARDIGTEHGKAAAGWVFDGNTGTDTYRRILAGIEDGDPEVMDEIPDSDLSGEWADGYTLDLLAGDVGMDPDDDLDSVIWEYEAAFRDGVCEELSRVATYHLAD